MIRSKTNFLFNTTTAIVLLIAFLYVGLAIKNKSLSSHYSNATNTIVGIIDNIKIDGDKLTIELIAKEKVLVNYYIKSYEELLEMKDYALGNVIKVEGALKRPNINTVFNLFNYRHYLLSRKIVWVMQANKITIINESDNILYKLKNMIIKRIENINQNKEYLYALVLGDSHYFDEEVMSSYRHNGITHLFAISGANVLLVATVVKKVIKRIFKSSLINIIILSLFLFLYTFLTGFSPSILRAVFLYIIFTVNNVYRYKINKITLFLLVFGLFLLYNPYFIYNLGFVLSFVICFYLLVLRQYIERFKNYFGKLLVTSTIAFLVSMPIIMYNFFEINILTPILNLIFVPLMSFIVFPLCLAVFFIPVLNNLLSVFINIFENLSLYLNNINYFTLIMAKPSVLIVIIYYLVISLLFWKLTKKRYYMVGILLIMMFTHYHINYFTSLNATFIDVGQGDSTLINMPFYEGNILIDTGGIISFNKAEWQKRKNLYSIAQDTIIPYLKSVGIKKLDYLIITHGDNDHMGEAINLVNNFKVENVIFNCGPFNDLESELIKVLENKNIKHYSCINELKINKYKLQFLNTKEYDNENDDSNVIYFKYDNYKFLFMGDAGVAKEKDILNKYNLTNIDFLKVGHHGSNTSSSEEFINSINPKHSLISVGKNNRYGHPKESVLDTLSNSKIYRTDLDGSIEIKLNKMGYKIRVCGS